MSNAPSTASISSSSEDLAAEKKGTARSEGKSAPAEEQLSEETRIRRLKLYRAALNGDWKAAKSIYDEHKDDIQVGLSKRGDTALHIAATATRIDFVKELVKIMNEDDLKRQNDAGSTALALAAVSGNVKLAKDLMKNNKAIAMVRDKHDTLPIDFAASLGHKDMVDYLYQENGRCLTEEDRKELFVSSIETDLYDFAKRLLKEDIELATARPRGRLRARDGDDKVAVTALHVLAQKDLTCSNLTNPVSGVKGVENKKLQALQLVEQIWEKVVLLSDSDISKLIAKPHKLVFDAAKRGNVEFLSILIRGYPDLIWKVDSAKNKYSIFHIAVKNRQEDVFKLIYHIGSSKEILFRFQGENRNNILHLAGLLPPKIRLNIISRAALQMQRELLWFKEVEKILQPSFTQARNKSGFTARELFTKEHEGLRNRGEQWMKDTATSCLVVAALIATVAFAAAITVPGGNNGDTGLPIFLDKVSFKIFVISDAISLVSSSASIMDFLSILSWRYAEEDFLWTLPRKLCIGLVTLFLSIAAMMVVFSTTFFIFFKNRRLWMAILITTIAFIPVIMFIWQHFKLFYDVLRSTYASESFMKKGKNRLFRIEEEESYQRQKNKIPNPDLKTQRPCSTNV
ncbi:Ankyrin repeat family protein [Melia azedarach]|uniref:Ankyrin repeat family protein n=1 Tax=Melia azedarach TaxID=155640 RepID=A0ACC1WTP1_MELAZ|nr:Ankyrin repeat family protein [Melia azedarach]